MNARACDPKLIAEVLGYAPSKLIDKEVSKMEAAMEMNKLISAKECAKLFSVHKVTWWRWCKEDPDAPKPVLREGHLTRWRLSDVIAYIDRRAERCAANG